MPRRLQTFSYTWTRLSRGTEPLRDLIGQGLGLQVGMVSEDPHVTELVGDGRLQLFVGQFVHEVFLERQEKPGVRVVEFDRQHQRILRHHGDGHCLAATSGAP